MDCGLCHLSATSVNGGDDISDQEGAVECVDAVATGVGAADGDVVATADDEAVVELANGNSAVTSFLVSSSLSDPIDTVSLDLMEADILWDHHLSLFSLSGTAVVTDSATAVPSLTPSSSSFPHSSFNLSKPPFSYSEAMA